MYNFHCKYRKTVKAIILEQQKEVINQLDNMLMEVKILQIFQITKTLYHHIKVIMVFKHTKMDTDKQI